MAQTKRSRAQLAPTEVIASDKKYAETPYQRSRAQLAPTGERFT